MASGRTRQILAEVAGGGVDVAELPGALVARCAAALPITGVGLMLMTDAGPAGTVAASDGPAGALEELQFTLGEGACVDCSRTGRPVLVADLAAQGPGRWPAFTGEALAAGVAAVFALPLRVGGIRLGVLDLYREVTGPLAGSDLAEALAFADAATAVLLHLQSHTPEGETALGPQTIPVLDDRAQVHQATGMVSVQAGVSLASALLLLRARAFATGRPVADLAHDVLTRLVHFRSDDTT
ncbi:GAF domain-containing protein [Pseudokineococcus marinus]|uniref:GAF domain-containing protein n=1 Tax=Pseudokineococcus marinus TaxID=351215 RepID=A0A849BL95_9ACTN|nr:GAF domain-containing protein [Pseudokineococcus marinus]NNH21847.1 GAF domain-containing protein [Pseudokineococcus marinus]